MENVIFLWNSNKKPSQIFSENSFVDHRYWPVVSGFLYSKTSLMTNGQSIVSKWFLIVSVVILLLVVLWGEGKLFWNNSTALRLAANGTSSYVHFKKASWNYSGRFVPLLTYSWEVFHSLANRSVTKQKKVPKNSGLFYFSSASLFSSTAHFSDNENDQRNKPNH